MTALTRCYNWSATSLGASANWSPQLRTLTEYVLSSPLPTVLFWGTDWIQIYNDAVADLLDNLEDFGAPVPSDWHRHWDIAESPFDQLRDGCVCSYEDRFRWFNRGGSQRSSWFSLALTPVRGDSADVLGAIMVLTDTTRQTMAEIRAQNADDRVSALLRVTPDSVFRMNPERPDLIDLDGREFTRSIAGPSVDWLKQIIPATEVSLVTSALQQGIATQRPFEFEHRVIKKSGLSGWSCTRAVPILDITRRVKEWYGAMTDISSRKETEDRLHHSERQFRRFGQASQDLLWIRDGSTLELDYVSPAAADLFGEQIDSSSAHAQWRALIHPADKQDFLTKLDRVRSGECLHHEYRICRRDRSTRWIQSYDFPILDESGRLHQIAGIARDVTGNDELEGRQQLAIVELNHRTRNLITLAKAIVMRTLDTCGTADEFEDVVESRLRALAGAADLLCKTQGAHTLEFEDFISALFNALGVYGDRRISLQGAPRIFIDSAHVPTLALAFHELLADAIKHGALKETQGRIEIRWTVLTGFEPRLLVEWRETCSQPRPRMNRGHELIEDSLRYRMKADTTFHPTDSGLHCTMSLPLALSHT